jgi:hypothetical protein
VLRKWPAACGLLLVVSAATLLPYYVVSYIVYLTDTPAEYAQQGSPAMILPSLLPSQYVIVALTRAGSPPRSCACWLDRAHGSGSTTSTAGASGSPNTGRLARPAEPLDCSRLPSFPRPE